MTIMILSTTDYAIKRSVMRWDGYDPRNTAPCLSSPVRPASRSEYAANRAMADFAVYRRTAVRLDYRSIYIRRRSDNYWRPRLLGPWLLLGALVAIAEQILG